MRRKDREVTDLLEIDQMLGSMDICHISMHAGEYPYTVALNFGHTLENGKLNLYFHCAGDGRKLDLIKNNPKVSFIISKELGLIKGEKACDYSMKFQSLAGIGEMEILSEPSDIALALDKVMRHFDDEIELSYPESMLKRTTTLRLSVKEFTAKRNLKD